MALTKHLRNKHSPVRVFFTQRLPNTPAPMNRNGTWAPGEALVLPASEAGYPWSTVGVAFDYRARYLLRLTPLADLVASSGARRLCRLTGQTASLPAAWPDLEKALSEAVAAAAPQEGTAAQEEELARLCLLLARFEELFRAPMPGPDWPLMRLGLKASLAQMLATADERAVADLVGLTRLFRERRLDLPGASLVLNPTFAGSVYVGGADADLIASGCLLDLKVSKPGRPKPHELWQLAGYALLDWEDEYALHSLAIYFARHGLTVQWDLDELLSLLAGSPVSVSQMRKDFRAFLTDLVGDVVEVSAQVPAAVTPPAPPPYEPPQRRVKRALRFQPSVRGTGRWHLSYANTRGVRAPADADVPTAPACGAATVLDAGAEGMLSEVGTLYQESDERLCRRCLLYTEGFLDRWQEEQDTDDGISRVKRLLAFHPPVSGSGKWHVALMHRGGNWEGAAGHGEYSGCGPGVRLDLTTGPIVPTVGTLLAAADARLCRNCLHDTTWTWLGGSTPAAVAG